MQGALTCLRRGETGAGIERCRLGGARHEETVTVGFVGEVRVLSEKQLYALCIYANIFLWFVKDVETKRSTAIYYLDLKTPLICPILKFTAQNSCAGATTGFLPFAGSANCGRYPDLGEGVQADVSGLGFFCEKESNWMVG